MKHLKPQQAFAFLNARPRAVFVDFRNDGLPSEQL
jgi:hypothetical protein